MTMGMGGVFGNPNMFGGGFGGGIFGPKVRNRAMDMAGAMMPQIDPETQGAINSYAAMPMEKPRGLFGRIFGGDFAGKMGGLASGLAKAQAYMDGDWGAAESITDPRQAAMMAEAQRRAKFEDWRAQFDYQQAHKAPEDKTPGYIRDAMAFSQLTPEQQALVTKFMDLQNPRFTNTPAGTQFVPRTNVPANLTPMTDEEIRAMNLNPGGPTPPASGGFRY